MFESIFKSFSATYITSVTWLVVAATVSSILNAGFISFYAAVIGLMYIWYLYSINVEEEEIVEITSNDEYE